MTYPLLQKAPKDHSSPEFLDFLRANNEVVYDSGGWLVIKNCKYWTKERPWLTAFWQGCKEDGKQSCSSCVWYNDIDILWHEFGDWEWLKKAKSKQTVKRFHIHLIKK